MSIRGGATPNLPDDITEWPLQLLRILLGYAAVAVPVIIFIFYTKRIYAGCDDRTPRSFISRMAKGFAVGGSRVNDLFANSSTDYELVEVNSNAKTNNASPQQKKICLKDLPTLTYCFSGIQVTLVIMGFLQEKIMTQGYSTIADEKVIEKFGDAQFLILCNRIVALIICSFVLSCSWRNQPPHIPPFYVHSYASFSNIMSSWCQYEALKYVSFPIQTIFKSTKIVAVMLMGTVVRGQRYSVHDYLIGFVIASGATLFVFSSNDSYLGDGNTTVSGIMLMFGYLIFDSFTPNWQKKLLDTKPKVDKHQAMFGVNAFSAILCAVSLVEQGTLMLSLDFALTHVGFFWDVILLSISSATGQLFIYSILDKFGPITLTVAMTIRQIISMVLSAFYYGHFLSVWAVIGSLAVFGAIFVDSYKRYFDKPTLLVQKDQD